MNNKRKNKMRFTYVVYREDEIALYLPVYKRTEVVEETIPIYKGAADWISYIDGCLKGNLTIKMLAENFNYSEGHFTDTFEMYFGVRPGQYIKKRRLYLMAQEWKRAQNEIEELVSAYGFRSIEAFRKCFYEEFCCEPENYDGKEYKAENLIQYYIVHKNELNFHLEEREGFCMAGKNVSHSVTMEENTELMQGIVKALEADQLKKNESQIVVWQSYREKTGHYCLVGPKLDERKVVQEEYQTVKLRGGLYMVMETVYDQDRNNLLEIYRMMYRCAFGGWIRENQEKQDYSRLAFIEYKQGKLYFCMPVK